MAYKQEWPTFPQLHKNLVLRSIRSRFSKHIDTLHEDGGHFHDQSTVSLARVCRRSVLPSPSLSRSSNSTKHPFSDFFFFLPPFRQTEANPPSFSFYSRPNRRQRSVEDSAVDLSPFPGKRSSSSAAKLTSPFAVHFMFKWRRKEGKRRWRSCRKLPLLCSMRGMFLPPPPRSWHWRKKFLEQGNPSSSSTNSSFSSSSSSPVPRLSVA